MVLVRYHAPNASRIDHNCANPTVFGTGCPDHWRKIVRVPRLPVIPVLFGPLLHRLGSFPWHKEYAR